MKACTLSLQLFRARADIKRGSSSALRPWCRYALQQLSKDVAKLKAFAEGCNVPDMAVRHESNPLGNQTPNMVSRNGGNRPR